MKKFILIFLIFNAFCLLYSSEFEVKSFKEIQNDLSARKYQRKDVNDEFCAIIKIRTDLEGLLFETNLGIEDNIVQKTGELWVYVSPGEKQIRISKEGFSLLPYNIPITIKSSTVYEMILLGEIERDKLPITIVLTPEDAAIYLDGEEIIAGEPIQAEIGEHFIEITRQGFKPISKKITVNTENTYFPFQLLELELKIITIKSIPDNATLYVNDIKVGLTDKQIKRYPGEYRLRIIKDGYETFEKAITVKEQEDNIFEFKLSKVSSRIEIVTNPKDAKVYVDGEVWDSNKEIAYGQHNIKVEKKGYDTETRTVFLKKGEKSVEKFELIPQTGNLNFIINPIKAKITLKKDSKTIENWEGSQIKRRIPIGKYELIASLNGYKTEIKTIIINKNQTEEISLTLAKYKQRPGSKKTAILLSTFLPGLGQMYSKQKAKGWLFTLSEITSVAIGVYYYTEFNTLNDEYSTALMNYQEAVSIEDINSTRIEMTSVYDDLKKAENLRNIGFIAAGTIYGINLLDAIIFGGIKEEHKYSLNEINNFHFSVNPSKEKVSLNVTYKW